MKKHPFFSSSTFSLIVIAVVGAVFAFGLKSLATPPGSQYAPGETLDPNCEPGDTNCTVAVGNTIQATSGTQGDGQIPFWTSSSKELSKSSNALYWDDLAKRLGVNTGGAPDASFEVRDIGDSEDDIFRVTGTNSTVGDSSSISMTLGDALGDSSPSGFGFDGGGITLQTGRGGVATGALGQGGAGGSISIGAQKGGAANATSSGVGGSGGTISINAGGGGNSGSAAAGASGGNVSITAGAGSNAFGVGAIGGGISLTGGNAGTITNTGGATASPGGGITFFGGNGGNAPSGSTNGNGGNITIQPGSSGVGAGASGSAGDVIISTSPASGGYVGIGLTNPAYPLHVKGDVSGNVAKFETSGGATTCTLSATTGLINCSSDSRLKKDVENIGSVLDKMLALRPVSYRWNTDDSEAPRKYGFIAQEVEEQFPATVTEDQETGYKLFSLQGLIPYIVKSLKELDDKVEQMAGSAGTVVNNVVNAVLEKLTVGSAEHPTGITLYDTVTGEPYCVTVASGSLASAAGECQ